MREAVVSHQPASMVVRVTCMAFATLCLVGGCASQAPVKDVSRAAALQRSPAAAKWQWVDVRTAVEYADGHIPGTRNVPLEILQTNPLATGLDRRRTVVLYCVSGRRAGLAAEALRQAGFRDVRLLEGSFKAWQAEGLPVERLVDSP